MSQSFDTLRVGHRYELTNLGDTVKFIILERLEEFRFLIKNLDTLEVFELDDLVKYGIGKDYSLSEIHK